MLKFQSTYLRKSSKWGDVLRSRVMRLGTDVSAPQNDRWVCCNSWRNPNTVFCGYGKPILKFTWKSTKSWDSRAILRKKSRAGRTTHATEHQGFAGGRGRVGLWGVRHGDRWDGAESSRAAPHKRGLGDGAGGIRGRKDRLLNEWRWTSRRSLGKTTNLDLDLAAYARG